MARKNIKNSLILIAIGGTFLLFGFAGLFIDDGQPIVCITEPCIQPEQHKTLHLGLAIAGSVVFLIGLDRLIRRGINNKP